MNRSEVSKDLARHAEKVRIKYGKSQDQVMNPWSAEEDAMLCNWSVLPPARLITIPNRSYRDICWRWTEIQVERAEKMKEELETQKAIQKLWDQLGI
jgi:hypothetical protein